VVVPAVSGSDGLRRRVLANAVADGNRDRIRRIETP